MSYNCDICNFKSERSYDLKVHERTVKHLKKLGLVVLSKKSKSEEVDNSNKNVIKSNAEIVTNKIHENVGTTSLEKETTKIKKRLPKEYICDYCNKHFDYRQNLWTHKKTCKCKDLVTENSQLKESMTKMAETVEEIKNLVKANSHPVVQHPISINLTNNDNSTNMNTMNMSNVYKFVNKNYLNALPLEMLPKSHAKKLLAAKTTDDHTVEEFLIYYYDKFLFDQFIGEIIRGEYKKDNPEVQQFWTTDVSRLSFVVRRVMQENEEIWARDPKGVTLTKYIIAPILAEVRTMMKKYNTYCYEQMKDSSIDNDEVEKFGDAMMSCTKIIRDINNNVLHEPILKYVTPHFQIESLMINC